MKKLVLAAAVALAPGCIFVSSSTGHISASWSVSLDGAASTCSAVGASSVEIIATGPDLDDETFNCDSGAGTTISLATGAYTVTVNILDSVGTILGSDTASVSVDSGATTEIGPYLFAFTNPPTQGNWHATWEITSGGAAATCADVGATFVSFTSTLMGGTVGNDDIFNCDDLAGDTDPYDAGSYTVVPALCSGPDVSNLDCTLSFPTPFDADITAGVNTDFPLVEFAF